MTEYFIHETYGSQSEQRPIKIYAKNLTAAKRKATSWQLYLGTVLTIKVDSGAGCYNTLARKTYKGWR